MKQAFIIMCGVALMVSNLHSESKPKADAHVRITDDLPKLRTGVMTWYNGVLSITNTGEVAFVIVTDEKCSGETILFYQEGTEEQQRNFENVHGWGKQWREQERKEVANNYYSCIEEEITTVTLQPGVDIALRCKFFFRIPLGAPGGVYKAEMYLGYDTWTPVHITPTLGTLFATEFDKDGKPTGDFYYSQEGTNQFLYLKSEDGKFKRVSEMKLNSTPKKEQEEDPVTFETPDGEKKKLTNTQAKQIVHEREQKNQ